MASWGCTTQLAVLAEAELSEACCSFETRTVKSFPREGGGGGGSAGCDGSGSPGGGIEDCATTADYMRGACINKDASSHITAASM